MLAAFPLSWAGQSPREDQIRAHERLSAVHRNAAQCLKSDAPIEECERRLRESCPIGKVEQCAVIDVAELERHKATHQMAGKAGTEPKQEAGQ